MLKAGDRVIVGGAHYVMDGEKVSLAEELDAQPELVRTLSVQPPRGAGRIRLLPAQPSGERLIAASDVVCLATTTPDPLPRVGQAPGFEELVDRPDQARGIALGGPRSRRRAEPTRSASWVSRCCNRLR